jgi:hypothetical protein
MKTFLRNILYFFAPFICLLVIEAFLPPTSFSFRPYEGLTFGTKVPRRSSLYPNSKVSMIAFGDLCHHTNKAIAKPEFWITDKLGFRNDEFIEEADILFIGDSFFAGASLSQDEIISNRVKSKSNNKIKVYNISPSSPSFSLFAYFLKTGLIKKPKLVIYSIVERDIPTPIIPYNGIMFKIIKIFEIGHFNVYLDKALKLSSIRWLKARIQGNHGNGLPAIGDSNMYFYSGAFQKHEKNDLQTTLTIINSYKKYCDSLDIKFLFMPMPDKETVYYELVPFDKQPNYLFQLDSLLKKANISTINTLKIYNEYRKTHQILLYHLDDTHWNSNATELMSDKIISLFYQNEQSSDGNKENNP